MMISETLNSECMVLNVWTLFIATLYIEECCKVSKT